MDSFVKGRHKHDRLSDRLSSAGRRVPLFRSFPCRGGASACCAPGSGSPSEERGVRFGAGLRPSPRPQGVAEQSRPPGRLASQDLAIVGKSFNRRHRTSTTTVSPVFSRSASFWIR